MDGLDARLPRGADEIALHGPTEERARARAAPRRALDVEGDIEIAAPEVGAKRVERALVDRDVEPARNVHLAPERVPRGHEVIDTRHHPLGVGEGEAVGVA